MAYDVLTIDTQTVYANGCHLDRGLVRELAQYKDGPIQVVLSEVVLRELHAMLVPKAKATHEAFSKILRDGITNGQISDAQATAIRSIADDIANPEEHAKKQLRDFVTATGALIIPAEKASLKELLSGYFGKKPPFSNKGKKDEFPDAISLLSLENWAKEENKKILAVSGDGDWQAFALQSEWVDCVNGLAEAMSTLLTTAEAARTEAREVIARIQSGQAPDLKTALDEELGRALEMETPYVEFSGPMQGEEEGVSLSLLSYQLGVSEGEDSDITLVRIRSDGFVVKVPLSIVALANVDISFSYYDSIDKDYVPMGSTFVEREIAFDASTLINFVRHEAISEDGGVVIEYEIEDAELIETPSSIDLDYVDFSLADDDFDPKEFVSAGD